MNAGMIVRSIAGRDKGRLHIVLAADKEYALIADGKWRKIETPKRKKIKHMLPIEGFYAESVKVTNKELRKIIATVKCEIEEDGHCQKKM
jgi:ribosomal protein L14E/L6E/L27E